MNIFEQFLASQIFLTFASIGFFGTLLLMHIESKRRQKEFIEITKTFNKYNEMKDEKYEEITKRNK